MACSSHLARAFFTSDRPFNLGVGESVGTRRVGSTRETRARQSSPTRPLTLDSPSFTVPLPGLRVGAGKSGVVRVGER